MSRTAPDGFSLIPCDLAGVQAVLARSHRTLVRHTHNQFGIGIVEQGGQLSHSGRGQVEAGPGDVITVNPGETHDGKPVGDEGRSWRIIYLDPALVAQAASELSTRDTMFELKWPVLRDARAARAVRLLFNAATRERDTMRVEELLLGSLQLIGFETGQPHLAIARPEVARARALIDDDPAAPLTLSTLAEVSGLTRFQLLRAFSAAVGLPPHAYVVQRRVDRARQLIADGSTLADAALASGFADQSHMTRAFSCRYGFTPGAFARVMAIRPAISFKTRER